tara:strand:- start:460 stop:687 length:228 start_codon:yes stop_codon:yes gene_type:complete
MKKVLLTLAFTILAILNGFSQSKKYDLKLTVSGLPLIGNTNDYKGVNGFVIKPALGLLHFRQNVFRVKFIIRSYE